MRESSTLIIGVIPPLAAIVVYLNNLPADFVYDDRLVLWIFLS